MEFIRRGSSEPKDFADLLIRKEYGEGHHEATKTHQERLASIFADFTARGQIISLESDGRPILSTPLILREYAVDGKCFDVALGIGRYSDQPDETLSLVLDIRDEHLLGGTEQPSPVLVELPVNGVEDVPSTHGVPELIDWFDVLYRGMLK